MKPVTGALLMPEQHPPQHEEQEPPPPPPPPEFEPDLHLIDYSRRNEDPEQIERK